MADWKTYVKAAQNTARKQAPDLARQAKESTRRSTARAGDYARAAGRALDEGTRESRTNARRDAAAYAVVAQRRIRGANLGRRLLAALRDALLMGLSIFVIWMIVSATGVKIPVQAVLVVVLVVMAVRFGWVLLEDLRALRDENRDENGTQDEVAEVEDAGEHRAAGEHAGTRADGSRRSRRR
ncbi:hypothetical protein [Brachybacterium hainanense]|uniref:Uncharacterized protein n=1 Tax=Brachybacterium hainanense TaxID=1541174 RepID=A0ABV6RHJ0_9MICO